MTAMAAGISMCGVEGEARGSVHVDPGQPPEEPAYADDWLRLARVRLRNGESEVAAAAARVAMRLDPALSTEAGAVVAQAEVPLVHELDLGPPGVLALELWPEDREAGLLATAGLVWRGGEVTALALSLLGSLSGWRVLEVGSGTGISGLAAAMCGAEVVLTDLPLVTPLLERNVARNADAIRRAGGSASVQALDYRDVLEDGALRGFDLVLGSDLVFKSEHCEPLAAWLAAYDAPCLFSYKRRHQHITTLLYASIAAAGLEQRSCPGFRSVDAHSATPCDVSVLLPPGCPADSAVLCRLCQEAV